MKEKMSRAASSFMGVITEYRRRIFDKVMAFLANTLVFLAYFVFEKRLKIKMSLEIGSLKWEQKWANQTTVQPRKAAVEERNLVFLSCFAAAAT